MAGELRCLFVLPSLRGGGAERVTTLLLQHLPDGDSLRKTEFIPFAHHPSLATSTQRTTEHVSFAHHPSLATSIACDQPIRPTTSAYGGQITPTDILHSPPAAVSFDLHLALVEKCGPNLANVPADVTVHDLAAGRVSRAILPLARLVRRLQPDIVFSTISHLNLAVAMTRWCWPAHTRLILRETAACRQILSSAACPSLHRALYRRFYQTADAIVCQTPYMLCDLQRTFQVPASKLRVISNPVDFAAIERLRDADVCSPTGQGGGRHSASDHCNAIGTGIGPTPDCGPHIVSLGRLRPIKGTSRLLGAFPHLLAHRPDAQLWLLGDGPCESQLRREAADLRIADRVHFVGYQANPYVWLKHADLMVLSSYSESSPNAILESVACGCPAVATRHPGGTFEMLSHLGLADRFVARLDRWEDAWFHPLPASACERARARYAADQVALEYRSLFAEVAHTTALCGRVHRR